MYQLTKGILITIEGIDGSGKSTLAQSLARRLEQLFHVILTKEPGASKLGKHLRELVQTETIPLNPQAEFLLFAADRAQHFTEVIIPGLSKQSIIISDRLADSSIVYQGYGRGLDMHIIASVNAWTMQGIKPDLTFYVKIDPEIALQRLQSRNSTLSPFEKDRTEFTQKLVKGFDTIFKDRDNVVWLDGNDSADKLTLHAYNAVITWIQKNTLIIS
jgi:dTMP kinase